MSTPAYTDAFWIVRPGLAEIRSQPLCGPQPGQVRVASLYSAISRGTESLVYGGRVPPSQYDAMRAPLQEGHFPGPVKYGYMNVGRVVDGPAELTGRTVFCLHPHQREYLVDADAVVPVPGDVPAGRAVLAANMETAVNAAWDGSPAVGERIAVIGAGVVGSLVAFLCRRIPGTTVVLIDTNPQRGKVADRLGLQFASPEDATGPFDRIFHASGHGEGLALALDLAGFECTIVEMSWFGTDPVLLPLGEGFHSRRLTVRSSQVGGVAPQHAPRWSHRRRLELALGLLAEPALDVLITHEAAFVDLPRILPALCDDGSDVLCYRIRYSE